MAYERLDEALRQLKTDRERTEATENQQKKAGAEAIIRFARIKSAVIGPIFDEVVARLAAEGYFGETVDKQNDASGPISLNVNLSEDDGLSRQGTSNQPGDDVDGQGHDDDVEEEGQHPMGEHAAPQGVILNLYV